MSIKRTQTINPLWSTPTTIRHQLLKLWKRGALLSAPLNDEPLCPYQLRLKRPDSRALGEQFDTVHHWIQQLQAGEKTPQGKGYRIEYQTINHRQIGHNTIPLSVSFETLDDLLATIDKQREAALFQELSRQLLEPFPQLRAWIIHHPHKVLQFATHWPQLITVIQWMVQYPRPAIYLRQIDLPGIDTKLIERHKKVLIELLDKILPQPQIDTTSHGVSRFEQRYGFLEKPTLIRFRILDPALTVQGLSDLTLPIEQFSQLDLPLRQLFITENEVNGLAFPQHPKSLVIFGLGYGLQRLHSIPHLQPLEVHYWGDIDTHGFAMLDQLRHYLPQSRSMLMDRQTLLDHRPQWGEEQRSTRRELPLLNTEEQALYQGLLTAEWAPNLRLEQERIRFSALHTYLQQTVQ
ncbi:MAG: hypothetical protein HN344_08880 [Gammaproteobacteria bacterium]|nr:hypothetical protein [Gammaproteobacteria bacterium]